MAQIINDLTNSEDIAHKFLIEYVVAIETNEDGNYVVYEAAGEECSYIIRGSKAITFKGDLVIFS